ncbi:MAG TPA: carbohydrate kinase family protein [Candidatus Acidoferrum sp.]|nr:carbohydrate kinase family protein [Candidatus Acidoferrum sp.]
MSKPSRGVVAVGGLSLVARSTPASASSADSSALRSAIGAWLAGVDAAICAVTSQPLPADISRDIANAGIDLSRVQLRAEDGGDMDPTVDQLASLSPNWSVHVCTMPVARQREIVRAAARRGALVTLDAPLLNGTVRPDTSEILELAAEADAFVPGRTEVERLWPGQPPREVLRMFGRRGVRAAVIKLGVSGSIGIRDATISWMPAFPITPSGITGGGDVYAGAFAAIFSIDRNLPRAMAWATAAASLVLESAIILDQTTDFARRTVQYRARMLEADTRRDRS